MHEPKRPALPAGLLDPPARRLPEPMHLFETQPDGYFMGTLPDGYFMGTCPLPQHPFNRRIPVAGIHVHRQHFHTVAPRVAHQLRGRVEPHRLAREQGRRERRGVVTLQPGRHVDQQSEARRVRLRKPILPEAANLPEHRLGELP